MDPYRVMASAGGRGMDPGPGVRRSGGGIDEDDESPFSVGVDDQTVLSEVTLEANQSLFRGPLYPPKANLDSDNESGTSQEKRAMAVTDAMIRTKCTMDESSKRMDDSKMDNSARAMSTSQQNRALAATDDISRLKFALASVRGDDAYAPLSPERRDPTANKKPGAKKPDAASRMNDYTGRGFITQEQYETNKQAGEKDGGSLLTSMTDGKPETKTDPLMEQGGVAAGDTAATDSSAYQSRVAGAWAMPGISSEPEMAVSDPNDSDDEPLGEDDRRAQELESNTPRELEEGLAEATPVEEAPAPEDLQAAEPVGSKNEPQHQNKHWFLGAFSALVALIVVAVVLAVVFTLPKNCDSVGPLEGDLASEETIKDLERLVGAKNRIIGAMEVLGGDTEALQDPDSAHSKALSWLLDEDEMQLASDSSNLLQRFVVALFYFSTTEDGPWTSCNPPEEDDSSLCYHQARNGDGIWDGDALGYTFHQSPIQERLATRWLTGQHECQWAGLFCNKEKELQLIQLDEKSLTGTIPDEISMLNNLEKISVSLNSLHGSLPASLARLKNLGFLDMKYNLLSGTIPNDWWGMTNLQYINLASNPLDSWTIPPSISQLSNLEYLLMGNTQITGEIPSAFYHLANLKKMWLRGNAITGTISTQMGLLKEMSIISLKGNPMSGTIPSEMAQMTELLELDLADVGLHGTIPEEIYFADYTRLNALILKDNDLTGTISTNIGRLSTLGFLYLDLNPNLVGTLPTEMGLLTKLQKIVMSGTQLSGTIPEELCANRGRGFLSRVKVDCAPISDGSIPMYCPEGCCTKCCNRETGECEETKYQEEYSPH